MKCVRCSGVGGIPYQKRSGLRECPDCHGKGFTADLGLPVENDKAPCSTPCMDPYNPEAHAPSKGCPD